MVNWGRALAFWLKHTSLEGFENKLVVEAGARGGGLSLWSLELGFSVLCTDRDVPSAAACPVFQEAAAQGRIGFGTWDLLAGPLQRQCDVVIVKSVLGALGNQNSLEPQRSAVRNIYISLRPGGELWLVENCVGSPLHMYARKRFVPWGTRWHYFTPRELEDVLNIFTYVRLCYVGFLGTLGRREWQRSLLGLMDKAFDRIIPEKWRYIGIAVAKKAP